MTDDPTPADPPRPTRRPRGKSAVGRLRRTERLRLIAGLRETGAWEGERSVERYSTEWGISVSQLRHDAADAGRMVSVLGSGESEVQFCRAALRRIAVLAEADGDYRAAAQAVRTLLEAHGAFVQRIDQRIDQRVDQLHDPAEAERVLVAAGWTPPSELPPATASDIQPVMPAILPEPQLGP